MTLTAPAKATGRGRSRLARAAAVVVAGATTVLGLSASPAQAAITASISGVDCSNPKHPRVTVSTKGQSATTAFVAQVNDAKPDMQNISYGPTFTVALPPSPFNQVLLYRKSGSQLVFVEGKDDFSRNSCPAVGAARAKNVDGKHTATSPKRILDTRRGIGAVKGAVGGRKTVTLKVLGRGGVPSSGVRAVVLNVTATQQKQGGYVTVYPGGTSRPTASNLNFQADRSLANLVVVKVGSNGTVRLFNGARSSIHLIADVAGYYRSGSLAKAGGYVALSPKRLLDTRSGIGAAKRQIPARSSVLLQVSGRGGVAGGAASAVLNVTATRQGAGGYVTVYPAGATRPTVSNLNFVADTSLANLTQVKLGAKGRVRLFNGASKPIDLVVDVAGYTRAGVVSDTGGQVSLAPARLLDTRNGTGAAKAKVPARGSLTLKVAGRGGVPASGAGAAVMNVTATRAAQGGYLTVYPAGQARPTASNLNFRTDASQAGLVSTRLGTGGNVTIYNGSDGAVDVIADVAGYTRATDTGTVVAYGASNDHGEMGDGTYSDPDFDTFGGTRVKGLTGAKQVVSGGGSGYALDVNGSVWVWGANEHGQLGLGDYKDRRIAQRVPGLSGVRDIAAGAETAYAVRSNGQVVAFGGSTEGEMGRGGLANSRYPRTVSGVSAAKAVAAFGHTAYALRSDGTVMSWGSNDRYQLGNGSTADRATTAVKVAAITTATSVAAGGSSGYALLSDGTMRAWGAGSYGQLGNGGIADRATPVRVAGLTGVASIGAADTNAYAVKSDKSLWSWGNGDFGGLGNNTMNEHALVPGKVPLAGVGAIGGSTDPSVAYALRTDGVVFHWGGYISSGPVRLIGGVSAIGTGPGHEYLIR